MPNPFLSFPVVLCIALIGMSLRAGLAKADEANITLTASMPLAGHAIGQPLSFDESARHLYVGTAEGVAVLDDKGNSIGLLTVPTPRAIVLADPLRLGFIAGGGDNSVTIFDPANLKVLRSVTTGLERIDAMALEPRTSKLFVASGSALDVIDVASMAKTDHFDLNGPIAAMTGDGAGRIFALLPDKSEIAVIDAKSDTVRDNFETGDACTHPDAMLLDDIHKHLFVTCQNASLIMIDSDYGAIEGSIATGTTIDNMVFDPGFDRIFASTQVGDILTIGPGDHGYAVLAQVAGIGGTGLALNAGSHMLYTLHTNQDGVGTLSILTANGSP